MEVGGCSREGGREGGGCGMDRERERDLFKTVDFG